MRHHILVLLSVLPLFLLAQSKSSIELSGSLDFTNLITLKGESIIDYKSKMNYHFGFGYNHAFKKRLYLKTGLRITRVGHRYINSLLIFESDYLPGTVTIDPNNLDPSLPRRLERDKDYSFLEIPLLVRLEWKKEGLTPFLEGGISSNIYL